MTFSIKSARAVKKAKASPQGVSGVFKISLSVSATGVPPGSRITTNERPEFFNRLPIASASVDLPAPSPPSKTMKKPSLDTAIPKNPIFAVVGYVLDVLVHRHSFR